MIKRHLAIIFGILVFALSSNGQLPISRLFTPENSGVSIMVPGGLMKHSIKTTSSGIEDLIYHTYAIDFEDSDMGYYAFILSFVDYPEGSMHSDSTELLEEFMGIAVKESIFQMRGEIIYESDEEYFKYPAKVWRINYKNGRATIRNKSIMIDNRFYMLQVMSSTNVKANEVAQNYLESFRLLAFE